MTITIAMIKELRDRTLVGMGDCKAALEETSGDVEAAIELLRKKGIAKAAKRAENATAEGAVRVSVNGNQASVVALGCETDFVSRNDVFQKAVDDMLAVAVSGVSDAPEQIEAMKNQLVLQLGENMRVIAVDSFSGDVIASYVHSNNKQASVVVAKAGTDAEKLRQVAMHIVAMNPEYLSSSEVSDEIVAKEREIQLEMMKQDPKNEGKTDDILSKIIEGKIAKFREENALLSQSFVVQPELTVGAFIGSDAIVSFKRYAI